MASQQESSFLESFGRTLGQLPMGIQSVMLERDIELELEKEKKKLDEQLARQQAAIERLGKLDRQKDLAADWQKDYGNKPEAAGLHGPIPEWGREDQLQEYFQYGQAGLDPEAIAKIEDARLRTNQLQEVFAKISNPAQQANILNKLDAAAHRQSGQVNYNRFTGDMELTGQGKAAEREAVADADLAETKIKYAIAFMNNPEINEMVRAEYARNGTVLKTEKAEIVEEDGKTYMADTLLMPDGRRQISKVSHAETGKFIEIPPEKVAGSESPQMKLAKELLAAGKVKTIGEGLELAVYSKLESDAGAWDEIWKDNKKGAYGTRKNLTKIYRDSITDYKNTRYGSPFRPGLASEIRQADIPQKDKDELLATISAYNQEIGQPSTPPADKIPKPKIVNNETGQPETGITNRAQANGQPLWNLDNIQFQQQPGLQLPDMPPPDLAPAPMAQPAAPATIPEQPEIPVFQVIAETILTNNGPAQINAALKKQGFDVSPENMAAMAIDAVNRGENAADIQQLLQLLGIQWTPPA